MATSRARVTCLYLAMWRGVAWRGVALGFVVRLIKQGGVLPAWCNYSTNKLLENRK